MSRMSRTRFRHVYFKVHTTGSTSPPQQILQLSAVGFGEKRFTTHIYAKSRVHDEALKVHGIIRGQDGNLYKLRVSAIERRIAADQIDLGNVDQGTMVLATDGFFYPVKKMLRPQTVGKQQRLVNFEQIYWNSSICNETNTSFSHHNHKIGPY